MSEAIVIAVDGPGGAGKGELTGRLARALGFELLDSGAIYRVLGYAVRQAGLALFDEDAVVREARALNLRFESAEDGIRVFLGEEDVTRAIRTEEAGAGASRVAALPEVRRALLNRQRAFARAPGLVADGRDMGTVVFPEAQVKIFLDASAAVRARRRVLQLSRNGVSADYARVLREIEERDERDRGRAVAPLRPAADAVVIDSSDLSVAEVFSRAARIVSERTGLECGV